jgi:two-component system nitrogen regulation sensor histidine kinase NtrY
MRKRVIYGSGIGLLIILVALVVSQGSFTLGTIPGGPGTTLLFWALSTLIFLLMVTLGFILVRTGVKLVIERRQSREGSRIKTKLVIGALALSFMPVFFMVVYSVEVLNRNLDKWFVKPVEGEQVIINEVSDALRHEMHDKVQAQALLLASMPETRLLLGGGEASREYLDRFCVEQNVSAAALMPLGADTPVLAVGRMPKAARSDVAVARAPVNIGGKEIGSVRIASLMPLDVAAKQHLIDKWNEDYGILKANQKNVRQIAIMMLFLIALFILFVATWIALFLARQISVPIAALIDAAQQVSKGNLHYRVRVRAIDELATLVRGFNQMTQELEANSRELEARRRFTEAILESIPTGVISVSADGRIQRVNQPLKRILSAPAVERAVRIEDLFTREESAEIRYLMNRARRMGLATSQFESRNGRQQSLAVTVSALEDKLTSGFVIVLEDTTELLRAQKASAWNEVARRVAHEIKNPLTPIVLSAERASRQLARLDLPQEAARILNECTDTIVSEAQSVKTLVDEFSQLSRFPAAQLVRADLNEVVESALSVFAGRLDDIEVRTDFARDLPAVMVDREQFKRVVVNLIDNAAEAMQDSHVRQLYIVTQPGMSGTLELVFADTGCGITQEQHEKLFLPYFSTKGRGTGLGLAIVSHILADHDAHIRVEDNKPAGARFTIELPTLVEIASELAAPA